MHSYFFISLRSLTVVSLEAAQRSGGLDGDTPVVHSPSGTLRSHTKGTRADTHDNTEEP